MHLRPETVHPYILERISEDDVRDWLLAKAESLRNAGVPVHGAQIHVYEINDSLGWSVSRTLWSGDVCSNAKTFDEATDDMTRRLQEKKLKQPPCNCGEPTPEEPCPTHYQHGRRVERVEGEWSITYHGGEGEEPHKRGSESLMKAEWERLPKDKGTWRMYNGLGGLARESKSDVLMRNSELWAAFPARHAFIEEAAATLWGCDQESGKDYQLDSGIYYTMVCRMLREVGRDRWVMVGDKKVLPDGTVRPRLRQKLEILPFTWADHEVTCTPGFGTVADDWLEEHPCQKAEWEGTTRKVVKIEAVHPDKAPAGLFPVWLDDEDGSGSARCFDGADSSTTRTLSIVSSTFVPAE